MKDIAKTYWSTDKSSITLHTPITKIDRENRRVSGFATLDNVDRQGDVVTAPASRGAFKSFRGNIREMHDSKIAAGKLVDFSEQEYIDPETGKKYSGIYVSAYVSKGAQSTWEKVLDGTLTGFSIGGKIVDSEQAWNKDLKQNVRFVKGYELTELSLVDSPANQLANIFSVEKVDGNTIIKGMIADVEMDTIFYCDEHGLIKVIESDAFDCPVCEQPMEAIGTCEGGDVDAPEIVDAAVKKFLNDEHIEGGEQMKKSEEVETENPAEDAPVETEKVDDTVDVDTPTEDDDLVKVFEQGLKDLGEQFEKAFTERDKATENLDKRIHALEDKLGELNDSYTDIAAKVDSFNKVLEQLNDGTAVSKALTIEERVEKQDDGSFWGGHFG